MEGRALLLAGALTYRMSSIRDLIQLQTIDTALSTQRTALVPIRELAAQQAVLREALAGLERDQRTADTEVTDARAHLGDVDAKLYSGAVRNPKELVSLQQDADMLRAQLGRLEDIAITALGRVEENRAALADVDAKLATAQQEHAALNTELSAQRDQLLAEIAELERRRGLVVAKVPASDLQIYTSVYGARQGRAVAKVERTLCQGCRVNLPAVVVQRVRNSPNLVQCPSCMRILYFLL